MEAGPTIDLTASSTQTVDVPSSSGNPTVGVILSNQSGYVLTVSSLLGNKTISPWFTDYIPVASSPGAEQITVSCSATQLNGASSTPQIVTTLVNPSDPPQIGYPVANPLVDSIKITGSADVIISQQAVTMAVGTNVFPISIPIGISSIGVAVTGASGGGGYGRTTNKYEITGGQQVGPTQYIEAPIGYGSPVSFDTAYLDIIPGDTQLTIVNMGAASYTAFLSIVGYGLPSVQVKPPQDLVALNAWFGWEVSNCNLFDTSLTYPYGEYAIQVGQEMMLLGMLVDHSAAINNGVSTTFWEVLALGGWASQLAGLPFPIPGNNENPQGPAAPGWGTIQQNPSVTTGPSSGTFGGVLYSDILKQSTDTGSYTAGQHSQINLQNLRIHLMAGDYIFCHAVGQTDSAATTASIDYEAQLCLTYALL